MMKLFKSKNSLALALFLVMALPALAFRAEEKLADPIQEKQAQELFHQLRCVVCSGEALSESSADMAHDMRALIRKEIAEGKTPAEIKTQFVANYGDQILQSPPVSGKTYFLWFAPFAMLIGGGIWLALAKRQKKA